MPGRSPHSRAIVIWSCHMELSCGCHMVVIWLSYGNPQAKMVWAMPASQRGVTLNHRRPCDHPTWLRSPSWDYSVLRRGDRACHLVHRGTACREPSSCSQRQGRSPTQRGGGAGREEEQKDKTKSAQGWERNRTEAYKCIPIRALT